MKACIRLDHLLDGTPADNARDAVERGLYARALDNGRGKWSDDDVATMRARRASGETLASIARAFGGHPATMSRIVRGLRR